MPLPITSLTDSPTSSHRPTARNRLGWPDEGDAPAGVADDEERVLLNVGPAIRNRSCRSRQERGCNHGSVRTAHEIGTCGRRGMPSRAKRALPGATLHMKRTRPLELNYGRTPVA